MSTKPRRTRIPEVSYGLVELGTGNASVHFTMPEHSSSDMDSKLMNRIKKAVNRALYDFNRGAGK